MHWVAQLTKNRPVIYGTPDSGSERDLKAAQMGNALWEYWWQDMGLEARLQTSLLDTVLSQGYWHISWDAISGKLLTYMVDPEGNPLTDYSEEELDIYRESLREQGIDPKMFEKTVSVGDISVKPIPGENVLLDPAARTFDDAKYAFVIVNMDVDELHARWPKDIAGRSTLEVAPDAVPGDEAATPSLSNQDERPKSVRRVYYGYFKPSPVMPQGRHVVWLEGPDMVLEDSRWNLPFRELPLVKFPGLERPDSALDIPRMTAARPLAKQMNRTVSQVVEHQNLTLRPQMLAPVGSLQERLTTEPGRTVYFNPVNGAVPQWRELPNLPNYVFENLSRTEAKLDKLFNRMPTQRDQLPARIDAPGSIDLIHEAVADQLSPVIRRLEAALVRAGMLMAKLAQRYYVEERMLKIKGSNGAVQVQKFLNADLEGGFSFHAEAGSGLPRTRAGKQARIEMMLERQLIDGPTALKYLDTADMSGLLAKMQAAEEQAYRMLEKIKKGQPVNRLAYEQAMMALQQGINPETGEPLQDPEAEATGILQRAAMQPMPHENPGVHMDVMLQFMNGVEFEEMEPDLQSVFITRYQLLQQAAAGMQPQPPAEKPKVTLQMKATSSAPVAGEILREAGIEVSDEQVAEPPLETWVTDSMDKADQDEAGNDPFTEEEKLMQMQQLEQKHSLQMAKAAHEVSQAEAKARSAQLEADDGNADERAEELHQQKLRHSEESHTAKLAQARQPKREPVKNGR